MEAPFESATHSDPLVTCSVWCLPWTRCQLLLAASATVEISFAVAGSSPSAAAVLLTSFTIRLFKNAGSLLGFAGYC